MTEFRREKKFRSDKYFDMSGHSKFNTPYLAQLTSKWAETLRDVFFDRNLPHNDILNEKKNLNFFSEKIHVWPPLDFVNFVIFFSFWKKCSTLFDDQGTERCGIFDEIFFIKKLVILLPNRFKKSKKPIFWRIKFSRVINKVEMSCDLPEEWEFYSASAV